MINDTLTESAPDSYIVYAPVKAVEKIREILTDLEIYFTEKEPISAIDRHQFRCNASPEQYAAMQRRFKMARIADKIVLGESVEGDMLDRIESVLSLHRFDTDKDRARAAEAIREYIKRHC